jgi:hypothetical protein
MIDYVSTASQEPKAQSLEGLFFQQPESEASPQTAEKISAPLGAW